MSNYVTHWVTKFVMSFSQQFPLRKMLFLAKKMPKLEMALLVRALLKVTMKWKSLKMTKKEIYNTLNLHTKMEQMMMKVTVKRSNKKGNTNRGNT